jgi:hypothetical protein
MSRIIVSAPLHLAGPHRQQRLRAIQGLNLGLLIHAEHQSPSRRVQVQSHDVSHLLDEQGVPRQFEGLAAVGLQSEGAPDPADGTLAHSATAGHQPSAPKEYDAKSNHVLANGLDGTSSTCAVPCGDFGFQGILWI